jgi:Tfp pilus assembly protein PilZ
MEKHVNLLQYWQYAERRQHPRRPCFIATDFAIQDRVFRDFVRNISPDGVFIETLTPLLNGAEITIVFSLPNYGGSFKTAGNIVWTSLQGIGVGFHTVRPYLEAMIRLL